MKQQSYTVTRGIFVLLILSALLAVPLLISAQDTPPPGFTVPDPANLAGSDPAVPVKSLGEAGITLNNLVRWVIGAFWIIVIAFLVWTALKYLTAQGDPEKVDSAKQMLIYTLVAGAIALLSTGIREIVTNLLLGQ